MSVHTLFFGYFLGNFGYLCMGIEIFGFFGLGLVFGKYPIPNPNPSLA